MTPELRERIIDAICNANVKCDDDTGLYTVGPDCKATQNAARAWLWVTGAGMALDAYDAAQARIEALERQVASVNGERDAMRVALEEIRDVQTGRYTTSKHPDEIIANIVARALAAASSASQGDEGR